MRGRRSRPSCRRRGPVWLLAAAVAAAGLSPGAAGEGPRPPPACAPEGTLLCLDDGRTRVGFDPDRGGALALLVPSAWPDARSLINVHDFGRYAQLSFYAAPDAYDPPTAEHPAGACKGRFRGHPSWPWNQLTVRPSLREEA